MTRILQLFLDGIGLGIDDPTINPFAAADTPTLNDLANGHRWLITTGRQVTPRSVFVPTDACFGVPGRPQSATGQAAIVTGKNVSALIGEHYGPRPNAAIRAIIAEDNIFQRLSRAGYKTALFDAKPDGFYAEVERGKRLLSSYQQAAVSGSPMRTTSDYMAGRALSDDFTGQAWRDFLSVPTAPVYTPAEAGALTAQLMREYDFSSYSTFITDELGHRGPFDQCVEFIERLDRFMAGLLSHIDLENDLILVVSDHGNLEDRSIRQHTTNPVPTVVIGANASQFAEGITSLTDLAPRVWQTVTLSSQPSTPSPLRREGL